VSATEIPYLQGYAGTFYNVSFSVDIELPHSGIYVLSSCIAYFSRDLDVAWNGRAMPFPLSHNFVDEVIVVPVDKHQAAASCPHDINPRVNCGGSSNGFIQPSLPLKAFVHGVSGAIGHALNARGVALVHAAGEGDTVNIEQAEVISDLATFFWLRNLNPFSGTFYTGCGTCKRGCHVQPRRPKRTICAQIARHA
jgi:hypothetical protein